MANNIIFSEKKINLNGLKELSRIISGNEEVYEPIINNQCFKEAVQGDPYAQYSIGLRFTRGDEVERNNGEAAKWYRKAAEQGYSEAQVMLGFCFMDGDGVKKSFQESARWFRKAAKQGNEIAMDALEYLELETKNKKNSE